MSLTKTVNEALKKTLKEGKTLLKVYNFEELLEYLEKTYECSEHDYFSSFYLVFYSNSGDMFSVQNTLYTGYPDYDDFDNDEDYLASIEMKPQEINAINAIVQFELLSGKDGQFSIMEAHNEFIKKTKENSRVYNDTGVYSYREFCGKCGMCIKTVLACPICGGRS